MNSSVMALPTVRALARRASGVWARAASGACYDGVGSSGPVVEECDGNVIYWECDRGPDAECPAGERGAEEGGGAKAEGNGREGEPSDCRVRDGAHDVRSHGWGASALALLLVVLLILPPSALAAGGGPQSGPYIDVENPVYDNAGSHGYIACNVNAYTATLLVIGELDKLPQIETAMYNKLANPSSGGRFYELTRRWHKIGKEPGSDSNGFYYDDVSDAWAGSVQYQQGLVNTYGYGRVWGTVASPGMIEDAHDDFMRVYNGEDGEQEHTACDPLEFDGNNKLYAGYSSNVNSAYHYFTVGAAEIYSTAWQDKKKTNTVTGEYKILERCHVTLEVADDSAFSTWVDGLPEDAQFVVRFVKSSGESKRYNLESLYVYASDKMSCDMASNDPDPDGNGLDYLEGLSTIDGSKLYLFEFDSGATYTFDGETFVIRTDGSGTSSRSSGFSTHTAYTIVLKSGDYPDPEEPDPEEPDPVDPPDTWRDPEPEPTPEPPTDPTYPVTTVVITTDPEPQPLPEPGDPVSDPYEDPIHPPDVPGDPTYDPTDPTHDPDTDPDPVPDPPVWSEPVGTSPTDYTPWLRAILLQLHQMEGTLIDCFNRLLDDLESHCLHIRLTMIALAEWLWGNIDARALDMTASVNGTIASQSAWLRGALSSDCWSMVDNLERHLTALFGELSAYLGELAEYIVESLHFELSVGEYDDENLIGWLRRIYGVLSVGDGPEDPDYMSLDFDEKTWEWWDGVFGSLVDVLPSAGGELVGGVGDSIGELSGTFPFSIPWDLARLYQSLVVEPVTPVFTFPLADPISGADMSIDVDLSPFDDGMAMIRTIEFLAFSAGLMLYTARLLKAMDVMQMVGGSDG